MLPTNVFLSVAMAVFLTVGCGGSGGDEQPASPATTTPVLVSDTLRFSVLETSQWHTCGAALDGSTWCWGANEYGELGTSAALDLCDIPGFWLGPCTGVPQRVDSAPTFTALAASVGNGRTCGLTSEGEAWCWGFGLGGQLGDGSSSNSVQPVAVAGGQRFGLIRSTTSWNATCAITLTGEGWCWGGDTALFGNGDDAPGLPVPIRVDWGRQFTALALGDLHGCGIASDGQAWCWGSNWYGQLGVGSSGGSGGLSRSLSPVPVVGGHAFRSIATGNMQTCALDPSGAAWCWGASDTIGSVPTAPDYISTPQAVAGGHVFVQIASGGQHTCGLTAAGEVWCWGQNYSGELGDGTQNPSQTPVKVKTSTRFTRLAQRATCALTADGQAWCWGDNSFGQVGRKSVYAH